MRAILDEATDPWGIKVNRVEVKNILPPRDIQDAMEKQMRAERERREKIRHPRAAPPRPRRRIRAGRSEETLRRLPAVARLLPPQRKPHRQARTHPPRNPQRRTFQILRRHLLRPPAG